jgi:hypothetical protein
VQSHVFRFPAQRNEPVLWFLASDMHLGHRACDVARIHREFTRAKELGASILINGDVFDAVTTGDKRYTPGETIDRIANARDAFKATVDYGAEVLAPYADCIKVVGVGNHETAWLKYRQSDPVSALCEKFKWRHGGISGFVVSLLDVPSGPGKPLTLSHTIYYHHGVGGDSPVTGGSISGQRAVVMVRADCITQGHRHNHLQREIVQLECRPNGDIRHRPVLQVMTGSYFRNYPAADSPLAMTYAEESAHPAKPFGGHFLMLTPEKSKRGGKAAWRVRQDHASALNPMLAKATA